MIARLDDTPATLAAGGFAEALARPGVTLMRGDAPRTCGIDPALEAMLRLAAGVKPKKPAKGKAYTAGDAAAVLEQLAELAASVPPSRVP